MCSYLVTIIVCTKILFRKSKLNARVDSFLSLATALFVASCGCYRWSLVMLLLNQPLNTVMNTSGCIAALVLSQQESGVTVASRHSLQSLFPASLAVFLHCWLAYTSGKVNLKNSQTFQCIACPITHFMINKINAS